MRNRQNMKADPAFFNTRLKVKRKETREVQGLLVWQQVLRAQLSPKLECREHKIYTA